MQVVQSKLNTVIRIKDILLKKNQRDLAEISNKHDQENSKLNYLENERSEALVDASQDIKAKARDLQAGRAFIQNLSQKINQQEKTISQIEIQEDSKREEVKEVSQSKKMFEELEERRLTEVEKELERKSQRLIDVIAQRLRMGT
jgi:flagellar export protein FliJ